MTKPHFQYKQPSPASSHFGYITDGNENIYCISNKEEFYKALGYTDEMKMADILPEEFIYFVYRKDNSKVSESVLQDKMVQYLCSHSARFREKYADLYDCYIENNM